MVEQAAQKVLVVEDNELNMKLFCDLLESHGYDPIKSRDGLRAIEMARDEHPSLIIMDIQLPDVSGLDLTRWIKDDEQIRTIPIMAVTAFAMKTDEDHVREAGCESYMPKPIQIGPFLREVDRLIASRGQAH